MEQSSASVLCPRCRKSFLIASSSRWKSDLNQYLRNEHHRHRSSSKQFLSEPNATCLVIVLNLRLLAKREKHFNTRYSLQHIRVRIVLEALAHGPQNYNPNHRITSSDFVPYTIYIGIIMYYQQRCWTMYLLLDYNSLVGNCNLFK